MKRFIAPAVVGTLRYNSQKLLPPREHESLARQEH